MIGRMGSEKKCPSSGHGALAQKWNPCSLVKGNHKLATPQAYTSKRRILTEVLPVPKAYIKSANACIHYAKSFCYLLMHIKDLTK